MNYFAIFKDSLREAVDTKVFYFTIGLSLLLILLIGSVSFRMVPLQEQLQRGADFNNRLSSAFDPQGKLSARLSIENFEQTNTGAEPWQGNYHFDYVIAFPDEATVQALKRSGMLPVEKMREQMRKTLPWADQITVSDQLSVKPNELSIRVETKGTKITDRRGWPHEPGLFFGAVPMSLFQGPLSDLLLLITDWVIATIGVAVTMIVSIIITAFFIPNMLRKGAIDLLLAKPIHRTTLLLYKFFGGLTFMFLNTLVILIGIWFVLGLQTGIWMYSLFLCIFIFTFQFAIFYAVSTLMAVLTRSPIVAILTSVACWALLFGIGWAYLIVDKFRPENLPEKPDIKKLAEDPNAASAAAAADFRLPDWLIVTVDVIHFVTPRYKDLDVLTTRVLVRDLVEPDSKQIKDSDKAMKAVNWHQSIAVTVVFIALMLGLSCWRFATRDY